MTVTLILPAKVIPNETPVRKPTGKVVYRLTREIKVFTEDRRPVIKHDGLVFLADPDGTVCAVSSEDKFAVDCYLHEAIELLEEIQEAEKTIKED